MTGRPIRIVTAVVLAATVTWFVARPGGAGAAPPRDARDHVRHDDEHVDHEHADHQHADHQHAGDVRWRAALADGPSDLAADADGVAVTTSAQSVYLLDVGGRTRWRAAVGGLTLSQPGLGAEVVVVGGDDSVTALARADGSVRWRRPRLRPVRSVSVAGPTALVGDDSGTLAAFDVVTGRELWSVRHPGALWSGARVDAASATVVATWHQSDTPAVRVLDLASGALRWEAPTDRYSAAATVGDGRVVLAVGDGERHARVEARDLGSGARQWSTPVPASFEEAIEPVLDHDAVAVVDHFGVVSLLDPATGRLRWQHDLADVVLATRVVLTAHRVAFVSYRGVLHVLDRSDGREVAHLRPERLGGLAVAGLPSPWATRRGVLLAVRLRDWGVQLRRLP